MLAESILPSTRVVYGNLLQALAYERDSINGAYDSLLDIVRRNLNSDGTAIPPACILNGLTGMLRFIFERLYHHTTETALVFVKEIQAQENSQCVEAVAALHDAIKVKIFSPNPRMSAANQQSPTVTPTLPTTTTKGAMAAEGGEKTRSARQKCCVFAVSPHYDWESKRTILEALTHHLNHTTVVLKTCEASREPSAALQLGCNVLVSPFTPTSAHPIAYATMEKVLQYAQSSTGEEKDDELDALLDALACTARPSPPLTEAAMVRSPTNTTAVVSRNVLQGALSGTSQNPKHIAAAHEVVTWQSSENRSEEPHGMKLKRLREEPVSTLPLVFTEPADAPVQLSQVIQYQRISPLKALSVLSEKFADKFVPDPSQWRFQISNSLKESKDEVIKAIRMLGGCVDSGKSYNPQTTHLVVAEGLAERTEKYLSCCAALKYIVSPRYVLDSVKRGRWIVDRLHEYDKNPLRRWSKSSETLPFQGWSVVLFSSTPSIDAGITTVLRAGGCTDIVSYIYNSACTPSIDFACIERSSHVLVECQTVSQSGRFIPPSWFPHDLRRNDDRLFSLELLFYLLCFCPFPVFDESGRPLDTAQLSPSCFLEIS